jgi:hypothetical protein
MQQCAVSSTDFSAGQKDETNHLGERWNYSPGPYARNSYGTMELPHEVAIASVVATTRMKRSTGGESRHA